MNQYPHISILMTVYSEPIEWIERSIDSVLNQTFPDFEFIIIYDNPEKKNTWTYLQNKTRIDSRIKIIQNKYNLGLTKSLNVAIAKAKGQYIARIDADDIWKESKLALQIDYLSNHPDVDIVGTSIEFIDETGRYIMPMDFPMSHIRIGYAMAVSNPIIHSSVMFKKKCVNTKAPYYYDETYYSSQDYALWTTLFMEGRKFANLSERLVLYRKSANQITKSRKDEQSRNAEIIRNRFLDWASFNCNIETVINDTEYEISNKLNGLDDSECVNILRFYLYNRLLMSNINKVDKLKITKRCRLWKCVDIKQLLKLLIS